MGDVREPPPRHTNLHSPLPLHRSPKLLRPGLHHARSSHPLNLDLLPRHLPPAQIQAIPTPRPRLLINHNPSNLDPSPLQPLNARQDSRILLHQNPLHSALQRPRPKPPTTRCRRHFQFHPRRLNRRSRTPNVPIPQRTKTTFPKHHLAEHTNSNSLSLRLPSSLPCPRHRSCALALIRLSLSDPRARNTRYAESRRRFTACSCAVYHEWSHGCVDWPCTAQMVEDPGG